MASDVYLIGEPMRETITGLHDDGAGSYVNSATVTYALKTAAGTTITGGTGSFTYTAASNGNYAVTIAGTVTALLTEGQLYYLWVNISGDYGYRRIPRRAAYRSES